MDKKGGWDGQKKRFGWIKKEVGMNEENDGMYKRGGKVK